MYSMIHCQCSDQASEIRVALCNLHALLAEAVEAHGQAHQVVVDRRQVLDSEAPNQIISCMDSRHRRLEANEPCKSLKRGAFGGRWLGDCLSERRQYRWQLVPPGTTAISAPDFLSRPGRAKQESTWQRHAVSPGLHNQAAAGWRRSKHQRTPF